MMISNVDWAEYGVTNWSNVYFPSDTKKRSTKASDYLGNWDVAADTGILVQLAKQVCYEEYSVHLATCQGEAPYEYNDNNNYDNMEFYATLDSCKALQNLNDYKSVHYAPPKSFYQGHYGKDRMSGWKIFLILLVVLAAVYAGLMAYKRLIWIPKKQAERSEKKQDLLSGEFVQTKPDGTIA